MVMSSASAGPRVSTDGPGQSLPIIPQILQHVAYVTYDREATADFHTRVMGMRILLPTDLDDESAGRKVVDENGCRFLAPTTTHDSDK